jgi:glycosyltransferase involved in cell wall biosynthesis
MLKLDNERSIVLFPCRIAPQKRPFMMLEIAQEVAKSITNVAFVVAGDGPQLGELNHEIDRKNLKDNVYCIGATDRIRECYRDSNLVLICSINEGLSLTAYEACSMGVPVVSADVGGQHDLIDKAVGALVTMRQDVVEDEDSRVFPREEILEYADNIVRILSNEDLASSMGQNARKKIESGFSVEKMVEHLDREIKKLLTDESAIEHRKEISEGLNNMPQLSVEFYMNYLRSEKFPIVKENIKLLYSLYYKLLNVPIIKYPVKHVGEMIYRKMV